MARKMARSAGKIFAAAVTAALFLAGLAIGAEADMGAAKELKPDAWQWNVRQDRPRIYLDAAPAQKSRRAVPASDDFRNRKQSGARGAAPRDYTGLVLTRCYSASVDSTATGSAISAQTASRNCWL